jgi:hypothetical protein
MQTRQMKGCSVRRTLRFDAQRAYHNQTHTHPVSVTNAVVLAGNPALCRQHLWWRHPWSGGGLFTNLRALDNALQSKQCLVESERRLLSVIATVCASSSRDGQEMS